MSESVVSGPVLGRLGPVEVTTVWAHEERDFTPWLLANPDCLAATSFFGLQLEVLRMGASPPAANLKIVASPNDWQKQVREASRAVQSGGKGDLYAAFWARLVEVLAAQRPGWTQRRELLTNRGNWLDFPSEIAGSSVVMSFARGGRLRHELYISGGDATANATLFARLVARRDALDAAFGEPLQYEELPGKLSSRIATFRDNADVGRTDEHEAYIKWFINTGDALRKAIAAATAT